MLKLNVLLREVGSQHHFKQCMELIEDGLEGALKQAERVNVALRAQLVGRPERRSAC